MTPPDSPVREYPAILRPGGQPQPIKAPSSELFQATSNGLPAALQAGHRLANNGYPAALQPGAQLAPQPPPLPPKPAALQPRLQLQPQGPAIPARPAMAFGDIPFQVKVPQGQRGAQWRQEQPNAHAGLSPTFKRIYKDFNLKVTSDTLPAYTDANVIGRPKELGSGKFNTTFMVKLKKPDGTTFDGVFKPLSHTENGWVSIKTGIPEHDPQIAMRNIATCAYAAKLGMDVVPETRVAVIDSVPGTTGPDLGLMMEKAQGNTSEHTHSSVFMRNNDVCREVTNLQLLDHLTGQGDRHSNNMFIKVLPNGKARITGIDNDQCFGEKLTDPAGIKAGNNQMNKGFRGTGLPPVVDTEMARAINNLTPNDIREMLGDKLTENEIQAAIQRHDGLKQHIAMLANSKPTRIISPNQWTHPNVQNALQSGNSYVGRERDYALQDEKKAQQAQEADAQQAALQAQQAWQVQQAVMQGLWPSQQPQQAQRPAWQMPGPNVQAQAWHPTNFVAPHQAAW